MVLSVSDMTPVATGEGGFAPCFGGPGPFDGPGLDFGPAPFSPTFSTAAATAFWTAADLSAAALSSASFSCAAFSAVARSAAALSAAAFLAAEDGGGGGRQDGAMRRGGGGEGDRDVDEEGEGMPKGPGETGGEGDDCSVGVVARGGECTGDREGDREGDRDWYEGDWDCLLDMRPGDPVMGDREEWDAGLGVLDLGIVGDPEVIDADLGIVGDRDPENKGDWEEARFGDGVLGWEERVW